VAAVRSQPPTPSLSNLFFLTLLQSSMRRLPPPPIPGSSSGSRPSFPLICRWCCATESLGHPGTSSFTGILPAADSDHNLAAEIPHQPPTPPLSPSRSRSETSSPPTPETDLRVSNFSFFWEWSKFSKFPPSFFHSKNKINRDRDIPGNHPLETTPGNHPLETLTCGEQP